MESSSLPNNPDRPLSSYPPILRITEDQLDRLLRRVAWAVRQMPNADDQTLYDTKITTVVPSTAVSNVAVPANVLRRALIFNCSAIGPVQVDPTGGLALGNGLGLTLNGNPLYLSWDDHKSLVTLPWFCVAQNANSKLVVLELIKARSKSGMIP